MKIIRTKEDLRKEIGFLRSEGKIISFVPTMGALHEGHLSLVDKARKESDIVVVSIFVNKEQFAPNEDFDKYPRQEKEDVEKLKEKNVDIVYLPTHEEMYLKTKSIKISVGELGKILEGEFRPHFFEGVLLVVTKLFMQVMPDIAIFGEKDYQQYVIIKKLVKELDIPIKVIGGEILRHEDGLAMSSRNVYLKPDERKIAPALYNTLKNISKEIQEGETAEQAIEKGRELLQKRGFSSVDYIEIRDAENLGMPENNTVKRRILAAAKLGDVRLLDNVEI